MEKIKSVLQAELDATTFEIAKSENVEARQSATSDSVACDNISWEQRRWELAKYMYELDYDTSTPARCIALADEFIKEYKKSLNTEE